MIDDMQSQIAPLRLADRLYLGDSLFDDYQQFPVRLAFNLQQFLYYDTPTELKQRVTTSLRLGPNAGRAGGPHLDFEQKTGFGR